jgi:hypothetical protein
VQARDDQQMREPGARVALAHFGLELGAACDHQRFDQRGAAPEQRHGAGRDAIAERPAPARRRVEQFHPARHEHPRPTFSVPIHRPATTQVVPPAPAG